MPITHTPGRFVWHEIFTSDVSASKKFYQALFGWSVKTEKAGEMDYSMFVAGDTPVGGIMSLDVIPMKGVPPHWHAYVSVPDVRETAAAVRSGGGNVLSEPREIKPFGSFVVLQDPQGGTVSGWYSNEGDPPEVERPTVGTFCWDSLATTDPEAAATFYAKVFGWTRQPMEGAKDMWVFMRGDKMAASLNVAPPGAPPFWMNYVVVENLADARKKVVELGGKVMMDEIPVPNIGKFAVITDNVGAVIAPFEGPQ